VFVDSVAQYPHILIFVRRSFRPGSFNTRFVENEALNGFVLQKKVRPPLCCSSLPSHPLAILNEPFASVFGLGAFIAVFAWHGFAANRRKKALGALDSELMNRHPIFQLPGHKECPITG